MHKRTLLLATANLALLLGTTASAQSFTSFDPRSMAMGGTGVAVSRPDTATFFNPSLLSLPREDDDFSLQLPYIGAKAYDPDDFEDSLDLTQAAIDSLDATIASIDGGNYSSNNFTTLANDTTNLNNALIGMDGDALHLEVGGGIAGGLPGENLGIGVYVSGRVAVGGTFNYEDSQTLADLASDANVIATCIDTPASCNSGATLNYIQVTAGTYDNPVNLSVNFDSTTELASTADLRGVLVAETGISFSHNYNGFALGITPKYVSVETFDYRASVDSADTDNFDGNDYVESYSDFNLDLGVSKAINEQVIVGLVVKNVIEQEYETVQKDLLTPAQYQARGGNIVLSPQARAGVSYHNGWLTLAADVDLTKNKGLGFDADSQQVGVGAEFDVLGFLQLRLGYKTDMEDSARNTASAGVGLAFLGAHIDIAAAGNEDEVGAAFEFGLAF